MFRVTRVAVAAVLAIAVGTLPLIVDRCGALCEAHQAIATTAPTCHHTTATGTHLTQVPSTCGHDHNGTAVTPANSSVPTDRSFAFLATSNSAFSIESPAPADVPVTPHTPPGTPPSLGGRTLPLRV
jgi:hypothetical protein